MLFCPRDGTPLASARNPSLSGERDAYLGTELPGQIRLEHLIGIGSMGRVYRAFQGGIERDVAVKVLHRELSGNTELVARFHREAKVASRLVHPNVVQVLMTGAMPQGRDPGLGGELYLVMEHLDGISLLSALAAAGTSGEGQALPLPRALHIALQICDAVGEAHAQGIVHRDLKPENVMLVRRGDDPDYVKVLDFGIARLDWADRAMATQAGLIFGTAKYISPEGAEGQPVGPQADVYSIATMLYQMLAGRTPFEGDSPVALLVQHTHTPPPALRTIARASYVPEPLAAAIMTNLSKKPADRAPNARAFGRDLIAAARAGGLFPEEIATQSTLISPASLGAVKLQSKERTRSHELSADLASRIGGVAAPPASKPAPTATPLPPTPTLPSMAVASVTEVTPPTETPAPAALRSAPPPPASVPRLGPGDTRIDPDLDHDDVNQHGPGSTVPGSPLPGPLTTMQGTETTLDGMPASRRTSRARMARVAALVACLVVAVPIVVVGGRRLSGSAQADSADAAIEEARDAMRRRAWDAPAGHNFKEITDTALKRWPTSTALVELRHEAAVALVADALGRKYANDATEATHLAQLALEMDPQLTTAQHLAADLAAARMPDVAPATSASTAPPDKGGKPPKRGRDVRPSDVRAPDPRSSDPKDPRPPPPKPPPSATGAVLPPPPAPKQPEHQPQAPTGPWL
ncbi:serine/threonine protein kinase [Minicystis rosea]|nr:serine/threonine protein kinase [Minicystis rosea]